MRTIYPIIAICLLSLSMLSIGIGNSVVDLRFKDMSPYPFSPEMDTRKDMNEVMVNSFTNAGIPYTSMYIDDDGVYWFDFTAQPISNLTPVVELITNAQAKIVEKAGTKTNVSGTRMSFKIWRSPITVLDPLTNIVIDDLDILDSDVSNMVCIKDMKIESLEYCDFMIVTGINEIRGNRHLKTINGAPVSIYWAEYSNEVPVTHVYGGGELGVSPNMEYDPISKARIYGCLAMVLALLILLIGMILRRRRRTACNVTNRGR